MRQEIFVIWSWEHLAWWAPNREGYTESLEQAGHYTFEDAAEITVVHIPAVEEIAVLLQEAEQRGQPRVYGAHAEGRG